MPDVVDGIESAEEYMLLHFRIGALLWNMKMECLSIRHRKSQATNLICLPSTAISRQLGRARSCVAMLFQNAQ